MEEGRFKLIAECARFDGEVAGFLEGEARPSALSHARECAPCAALLADLETIRQAARELPQEEPSRAVWANLRARLEAEGAFSRPGCLQFAQELAAYLEGEARSLVVSHSQNCANCGATLADLQLIQHAARDLPQEEPASAVWAKVRARLEAEGILRVAPCRRFAAELADYLEGESNPFIVSHAQECAPCGAALADVQLIRQTARDLPLEEPSRVVWADVRAQLEAEGVFHVAPCRRFAAELAAYLEGESNPFIVSHAQECAPCGAALADLQAIRQTAHDLPIEEPSPVVWANVRAQLDAEGAFGAPVRGWRQILAWRWTPQAVPLGVLAGLVVLGSILTLPSGDVQWGGGAEELASAPPAVQTAAVAPSGEDSTLARVAAELEKSFRANEASMAPDLKASYEKSLVSLDGSIRECLDSLRHEPRNTLAHEYLVTAYTRKTEILSSALEFDGR